MTLIEFLLARIAEDEGSARAAFRTGPPAVYEGAADAGLAFIERHSPNRVLAECEAMRRIVEGCSFVIETERVQVRQGVYERRPIYAINEDHEDTVRALAEVYADHPDYREEWKR